MREFHIITGMNRGGAEAMLCKLSHVHRGQMFASILSGGALRAGVSDSWQDCGSFLAGGVANSCASTLRMLWVLWRAKPDVIMSWMYHADLLATVLGAMVRVPVIWNLRNSVDSTDSFRPRTLAVIRGLACLSRICDKQVATNSRRAIKTHEALGYRARTWIYLPNGFDLRKFVIEPSKRTRSRQILGITDHVQVIGIAGRYSVQKNYGRFFKLARRLAAQLKNVHFLAAGKGVSAENPALSPYLSDPILKGRVKLLGEIEDTSDFYPALDVFCLTSDSEGFPNVIGEAMACGVPCVCTDVGDCAHLVGSVGRVVGSSDDDALFDACRDLLQEDKLGKNLRRSEVRRRIEQHFEIATIAEMYDRVLSGMATYNAGIVI